MIPLNILLVEDDNIDAMEFRRALKKSQAEVAVPSARKRFLTGFLTNATNPKGIIFMVAVLPQFISKDAPLLTQLAILGVTMVAIDSIVMHGYAALAASMQRFMRDPRHMRLQNRVFGAVLVVIGSMLFFVKRQPA